MVASREIHLKSHPHGVPRKDNFELVTVELPEPGAGQLLVRNIWMSVDPYMRGRMYDRESYVPPFGLDVALDGGAVGEVVRSNNPAFEPGDLVLHMGIGEGVGVRNLMEIVGRRLTMRGFIVGDFMDRFDEAMKPMITWYHEGRLNSRSTVHEGIEHAVDAMIGLFEGTNTGKMLVNLCSHEHGIAVEFI